MPLGCGRSSSTAVAERGLEAEGADRQLLLNTEVCVVFHEFLNIDLHSQGCDAPPPLPPPLSPPPTCPLPRCHGMALSCVRRSCLRFTPSTCTQVVRCARQGSVQLPLHRMALPRHIPR